MGHNVLVNQDWDYNILRTVQGYIRKKQQQQQLHRRKSMHIKKNLLVSRTKLKTKSTGQDYGLVFKQLTLIANRSRRQKLVCHTPKTLHGSETTDRVPLNERSDRNALCRDLQTETFRNPTKRGNYRGTE